MGLYRKKPVTINAVLNNGEWSTIIEWLDELVGGKVGIPFGYRPSITRNEDGSIRIATLEGDMRADVGDWIICGVEGEFYPCKPGIFEATYEEVFEKGISRCR